MLRACLLVLATAMVVPLSVFVACNDVETKDAPDVGRRPCDSGPFTFDAEGNAATGISAKPSGPACSADGTNLDVINRLPRGGWYPVGWSAQTVGTQDTSGQGECKVITVCKCVEGTTTTPPPPEPVDAGPDAAHDAAAPPAPKPTTTGPSWQCG